MQANSALNLARLGQRCANRALRWWLLALALYCSALAAQAAPVPVPVLTVHDAIGPASSAYSTRGSSTIKACLGAGWPGTRCACEPDDGQANQRHRRLHPRPGRSARPQRGVGRTRRARCSEPDRGRGATAKRDRPGRHQHHRLADADRRPQGAGGGWQTEA